MASTKTLIPTIFSRRGFTLFEILIVIGLIGIIMVIVMPKPMKPDSAIKKTARHLMVLGRDVRNQARLKNRTFRLVLRMDGKTHGYWVESAPGNVPPKTQLRLEEDLKLPEDQRPKDPFQKETKFTKKEFDVPKEIFIGLVDTPASVEGVSAGYAFVYFSPEGLMEPAAIQLTDRKQLTWTLVFNPLTGHADIFEKAVRLRDVKED